MRQTGALQLSVATAMRTSQLPCAHHERGNPTMLSNPSVSSRSPSPMLRRTGPLIAAALLAAWLPATVAARSEEVVTAPSGVTYVSGGAGTEAVDRLRAMEKDFNLKLVFALNNGEYVADVRVTVVDAANKVVLDTTSEGPWLLARLPAGTYQVNAAYGRSQEHRSVALSPASLKTVDFRWPTE